MTDAGDVAPCIRRIGRRKCEKIHCAVFNPQFTVRFTFNSGNFREVYNRKEVSDYMGNAGRIL